MAKRKVKPRNKKGSVGIHTRNGMLVLRWRCQGKPYHKALGMVDNPLNRRLAEGKANEIQADIAYGRFDATLERYFPCEDGNPDAALTTADLFQRFIDDRRLEGTSGQAIAARYNPLLSNLKRFNQRIEDTTTARGMVELLRSRQSPPIANQNLSLLKAFGDWCVAQGLLLTNPYKSIKPLKSPRRVQNREPFTTDEVKRFLEAIRADSHTYLYHDFCVVLFSLGLRPSEAIGLRWQHLDLARKEVIIRETMARSEDGRSSGYARQRKETKTGKVRTLPLSDRLVALLQGRRPSEAQPDDLVFTTAQGCVIDDRNFRERVWKRACEKAGIKYRPPYTARHTLLSHGIEYEGWTLPQAAQIAGHASTRMVAETYGHALDRPRMPEY